MSDLPVAPHSPNPSLGSADLVPLPPGQTPRRWQTEAMLALRRFLPEHKAIIVSAATGTGKGSLIAAMVVKAARAGKRTLFLVHRDELIDDVMRRALAIAPHLYAGKVQGKTNEIGATAVFASVQTLKGKRLAAVDKGFDFVITDECFVAGTPICMADGSDRAIEDVRVGDLVLAYDEAMGAVAHEVVTETMVRRTTQTVSITVGMVRLRSTANHPVFTQRGWVRAGDLTTGDEVKCATVPSRHLRPVQQPERETVTPSLASSVLRSVHGGARTGEEAGSALLRVRNDGPGADAQRGGTCGKWPRILLGGVQGGDGPPPQLGDDGPHESPGRFGEDARAEPDGEPGDARAHGGHASESRASAGLAWWKWARADRPTTSARRVPGRWLGHGVPGEDRSSVAAFLQGGHWERVDEDRNRSGRGIASAHREAGERCASRWATSWSRVDRVEVHKHGGDGESAWVPVYNLGVARVHTYVAAGIVVHNCHHSNARSYRAIYARAEELNPRWKHIGFTATPFRSCKAGATKGLGLVFEQLVYEYSLQDAVTEGALCPVRGVRVETELDLTGVDPDDESEIAKAVDTDERNAIVADKYVEHAMGRQGIAFSASIQHAENLAAALRHRGVNALAVWGTDPLRAAKIADYLASRVTVLCNNNLLSEGFDAPATSVVLLARPTQSRGLYAQQVGRVTRLHPGKSEGLVLDFVDNSTSHSLASMSDLTIPLSGKPRIEVGATVRHRRFADLGFGVVVVVKDFKSADEPGKADVLWQNPCRTPSPVVGATPAPRTLGPESRRALQLLLDPANNATDGERAMAERLLARAAPPEPPDLWWPCLDLVLLRPASKGPDEMIIVPSVIGVNEFAVNLFGGRRVGWYTYEGSRGKVLVARGKHRGIPSSAVMLKREGEWEAWLRQGESAELLARGDFATAEASVDLDAQPYDKDWQRDPATEGQIAALKRFKVRRENLSKGEASLILEMKIALIVIDRLTSLPH